MVENQNFTNKLKFVCRISLVIEQDQKYAKCVCVCMRVCVCVRKREKERETEMKYDSERLRLFEGQYVV
jgi:hypothetical protein